MLALAAGLAALDDPAEAAGRPGAPLPEPDRTGVADLAAAS